jgi:hypothetical protein
VGESTVYRHLDTVALIVGVESELAAKCKDAFERVMIRVVRVGHAAAACERLPVVMPQVLLLLDPVEANDRENLVDRATAVGALMFDVNSTLRGSALDAFLDNAAKSAIERGLQRDTPPDTQAD